MTEYAYDPAWYGPDEAPEPVPELVSLARRDGGGWEWTVRDPHLGPGYDMEYRTNSRGEGRFWRAQDYTWHQDLGTLQFSLSDSEADVVHRLTRGMVDARETQVQR